MQDLSQSLLRAEGRGCPTDQMQGKGGAWRGSSDLRLLWGAVEALWLGLEDEILRFNKFPSRSAYFTGFFAAEHSLASPPLRMIQLLEP